MLIRFFTLILLVLAVWLSPSCNQEEQPSPAAYNDSLVIEQLRIMERVERLEESFETYVKEEMELTYDRLGNQLKEAKKKLAKIKSYEGSTAFRDGFRELIDAYEGLWEKEYRSALNILSKSDSLYTTTDEARLDVLFNQIDNTSEQATARFKKIQDDFAAQHKLVLTEISDSTEINK